MQVPVEAGVHLAKPLFGSSQLGVPAGQSLETRHGFGWQSGVPPFVDAQLPVMHSALVEQTSPLGM